MMTTLVEMAVVPAIAEVANTAVAARLLIVCVMTSRNVHYVTLTQEFRPSTRTLFESIVAVVFGHCSMITQ